MQEIDHPNEAAKADQCHDTAAALLLLTEREARFRQSIGSRLEIFGLLFAVMVGDVDVDRRVGWLWSRRKFAFGIDGEATASVNRHHQQESWKGWTDNVQQRG